MRTLIRLAAALFLALLLAYGADAAWLSLRTTDHRLPTRSVQVHVLLVVPQKGNKVEYIPGGTRTESCVPAIFPHAGLSPCWYLERHTRREVDY